MLGIQETHTKSRSSNARDPPLLPFPRSAKDSQVAVRGSRGKSWQGTQGRESRWKGRETHSSSVFESGAASPSTARDFRSLTVGSHDCSCLERH